MDKQFIFDRLVDRGNICGLKKEIDQLNKLIKEKRNIVIYAPRNFGKTSLVKNIIIPDFKHNNKKSFTFFVDLMGVKDLDSITSRLKNSLEHCIKETFPVKKIFTSIVNYFSNLKAELNIDITNAKPTIKITSKNNNKITIDDILQIIKRINNDYPSLIVIDEFQDIALIAEAESLLRNAFQQISDLPIIILGSKKHLLKNIFALPNSPLANWGTDIAIEPIDYQEYFEYIKQRFAQKKLTISLVNAKYIQDQMERVPEAINMLCYEIYYNYQSQEIDITQINAMMLKICESRRKRFETILSGFSSAEEKVVIQIAKENGDFKPQSKDFCSKINLTPRTVKINIDKLMNQGIVDLDGIYYLCDPLFRYYLREFR